MSDTQEASPDLWWRCNACDDQFPTPEIWPGEAAFRNTGYLDERELAAKTLKVCPSCHSSSIEKRPDNGRRKF